MLVAARVVQGAAAAILMPSSMSLIGEAYVDPPARRRAVGVWAMGGAVAASSAPLLGGLLTLWSWRAIFFVNVPVGVLTLTLLARTQHSEERPSRFDWVGQLTAILTLSALTFGAIQTGAWGFRSPAVLFALVLGALGLVAFATSQVRVAHAMMPRMLRRNSTVRVTSTIGLAYMIGYYGSPFVLSLYLQDARGLSALQAGAVFVPMFAVGLIVTPFVARIAERIGARMIISLGLGCLAAGLALTGFDLSKSTSIASIAVLMILVGLSGPLVMPMTIAQMLHHVAPAHAGTASGIFNTSRQVGGVFAIAVFGGLLGARGGLLAGAKTSLFIAGSLAIIALLVGRTLDETARRSTTPSEREQQ